MKKSTRIILIITLIVLFIAPLYMNKGAEFGGADGAAEDAITENNPWYEQWFLSLIHI